MCVCVCVCVCVVGVGLNTDQRHSMSNYFQVVDSPHLSNFQLGMFLKCSFVFYLSKNEKLAFLIQFYFSESLEL